MKIIKILLIYLLTFVLSYVLLIEPNLLKVEYINKVENPKFTIALLGDIHFNSRRTFHETILENLQKINPDLILNAGDIFSNQTNMEELKNFLDEINQIAPMISILGNWEESAALETENIYNDIGSKLLHIDTITIQKNDTSLNITGIPSKYYFRYLKDIPAKTSDNINILLIHSPYQIEKYPEIIENYDYIYGAHTHGGQIYMPFLTKKIMELTHDEEYKFFKGNYNYKNIHIYITNGLGQVFPGRLFSIPEINVIELD